MCTQNILFLESTADSKTETGEKSKKSDDNEMDTQEEEDDDDLEDRFQLLEKGIHQGSKWISQWPIN